MCDARLKDGSRVNGVIPPVAIYGPCLTIRKFGREVLTPERIGSSGGSSEAIVEYLSALPEHHDVRWTIEDRRGNALPGPHAVLARTGAVGRSLVLSVPSELQRDGPGHPSW